MKFKSLLILPLLVASLQAADVDDLTFVLNEAGTEYSLTDCNESATDSLDIPSTYNGLPVTSIGDNAFLDSSLASITIPNSVTSIGNRAFSFCRSLNSVTFEGDAPTFGTNVFYKSNYLYYYGSSSLVYVTINYDPSNSGWDGSVNGTPIAVTNTLSFSLNGDSTGYNVMSDNEYVDAMVGSLEIPSTYDGLPVTSIGSRAFDGLSGLTSITIPDSVTSIGSNAFDGCSSLTSITIPDSVTSIGNRAFDRCSSLTSITIPDSVTSIGNRAFWQCSSLTSINIPNSVTTIGDGTFEYCSSLTNITIPDSVTSIGDSAFKDCYSLESITIGDGVTSIVDHAFDSCFSLTSITIPDSVTSIGLSAFKNCTSLASVKFEGDAPTSEDQAFDFIQASYIIVEGSKAESYGGDGATYSGLTVVDTSKVATAANLYTKSAYDTIVAERDARLTIEEVMDARIGSTMIEVSEGKADITMTLEETSDLSDWSDATTSDKTIEVDAPAGTRFYRFKMTE